MNGEWSFTIEAEGINNAVTVDCETQVGDLTVLNITVHSQGLQICGKYEHEYPRISTRDVRIKVGKEYLSVASNVTGGGSSAHFELRLETTELIDPAKVDAIVIKGAEIPIKE